MRALWHDEAMDRQAIIAAESRRFAEVLSGADPNRRCPTCPDWTASDLLWHLTEVHFFCATILARRMQHESELQAVERDKPSRPEAVADMLALREQATAVLLDQLAKHEDNEACWSWWAPDQTVGFTRRMQTYEATMHRLDAELTADVPVSLIATDVAEGAVDHAVDVMWGWMPNEATYRTDSIVNFVATDTGQSWSVEVGTWTANTGDGPRAVRATAGEPTATVTGSVVDLALWVWTRGGSVQTAGDPSSLAALNAVVSQGMP
jgi:uncharacterized protein (TIGR03083 family)